MPVSTACKQFSVDLFDPVDLIHGWDILEDGIFYRLFCLCEIGLWERHLSPLLLQTQPCHFTTSWAEASACTFASMV